jgi:hypothetical protein
VTGSSRYHHLFLVLIMIYIVWAPPREGKTYFCTRWALGRLRKNQRVYTNYPIIDSSGRSSMVWTPDLVHESIHDALIVIDEAYRDYNSRSFKSFSGDEHTFFATNGHNNLDIVLIAQNPARVDVVIREMTNIYFFVRKLSLPFVSRPLAFRVLGFLDELSMSSRDPKMAYSSELVWFRKYVAQAYDTHYFRKNSQEHTGITWKEHIESNLNRNEQLRNGGLL